MDVSSFTGRLFAFATVRVVPPVGPTGGPRLGGATRPGDLHAVAAAFGPVGGPGLATVVEDAAAGLNAEVVRLLFVGVVE